MRWVASTLHTTSEHGVSSITAADAAHLGCQQSTELTPHQPADLNGLVRFARKTKSGFCACAVIFQKQSTFIGHLKSSQCLCSTVTCCLHVPAHRDILREDDPFIAHKAI